MHLLYLIFGNNYDNYLQAHASILSFKAHCKELKTINIITDSPQWFSSTSGEQLHITQLSPQQLQAWKGEHNFFWRAKIKAIQQISQTYPGEPIVYLDTDTFLYTGASRITQRLAENKALMHLEEGPIKEDSSKTIKKMYRQILDLPDAPLENLADYHMWNAGVVASPNSKDGREFALALKLCDYLCKMQVTDRLIEQFSLSVALEHCYGLEESMESIAHYWSNKKQWNAFWSQFFLSASFKNISPSEMPQHFTQQDFAEAPAVLKISKNTKKRLISWLEKKFPDKKVVYLHP